MMATVEELKKTMKQASDRKENLKCASDGCGWDGDESLILDYDERGPHLACPVCKEEIPTEQ